MVQRKKFIGMKTAFYTYQSHLHCTGYTKRKSRKPVAAQSEIGNLAGLQLKLQFVSDKGYEFRSEESAAAIGKGIVRKMPSEKW